jgi:hypothetical protein
LFEFGAFDESDAVVGGEAAAVVAEPGGCDEDGVVGAFVVQDSGECADVVGGDDLPVSLGLDDVLAAQNGVAVEEDPSMPSSRERRVTLASPPFIAWRSWRTSCSKSPHSISRRLVVASNAAATSTEVASWYLA